MDDKEWEDMSVEEKLDHLYKFLNEIAALGFQNRGRSDEISNRLRLIEDRLGRI